MREISEVELLNATVIKGDYCIGCGACATVKNSPFKMKMNEYGNYVASINQDQEVDNEIKLLNICPFSGESKNERELGEILFPQNIKDDRIGNYIKCFSGYVKEGEYREKGSSGGLGKWLGHTLLKDDFIDCFIQVSANSSLDSKEPLFRYQIFKDSEEVILGSKSCYYPTTLEEIIFKIRETPGKYAITGIPCFIKTLRLLSLEDEVLSDRIKYTISVVCGGMKSANHAKAIGWQLGVHPNNLRAIDFRRKYLDRPASHKIYQVWSNIDNIERYENSSLILGTDWGPGYFKPNACDYCDDVVGELADISLGDAWLPQYVGDSKGTSIVIIRNSILLQILENYNKKDHIYLEKISKDDVVRSQAAGFRQRREALSYRLAKKEKNEEWFPKKRVVANEFKITSKRKRIYSFREKISKESHEAFLKALQCDSIDIFYRIMKPLEKKYQRYNRNILLIRIYNKIRRIFFINNK